MPAGQYSSTHQRIALISLAVLALVLLTACSNPRWTLANGEPAPNGTILTLTPDENCDWKSATFLHIGMPLGTIMESGDDVHQYIRDPDDVFVRRDLARSFNTTYSPNATLPPDAKFSGFKRDGIELWTSQTELK
jgi:hypothetical protein